MYAAPSTPVPPPLPPTPMLPPSAPGPLLAVPPAPFASPLPTRPLESAPSEPPHPKAPRTSRASPDDDAGRIVQLCLTARRNWSGSYRLRRLVEDADHDDRRRRCRRLE